MMAEDRYDTAGSSDAIRPYKPAGAVVDQDFWSAMRCQGVEGLWVEMRVEEGQVLQVASVLLPSPGPPVEVRQLDATRMDPQATHLSDEGTTMTAHQNIAEWQGKDLVDDVGDKVGKLEEVYVDVETDEPMFGTVKEGLIGRHLTFVPLTGLTIGPDSLQLAVSKELVKTAPNIELNGEELSQDDESSLYHHYQLNYAPPETESGRRLARR